jgi:hypothetical protein
MLIGPRTQIHDHLIANRRLPAGGFRDIHIPSEAAVIGDHEEEVSGFLQAADDPCCLSFKDFDNLTFKAIRIPPKVPSGPTCQGNNDNTVPVQGRQHRLVGYEDFVGCIIDEDRSPPAAMDLQGAGQSSTLSLWLRSPLRPIAVPIPGIDAQNTFSHQRVELLGSLAKFGPGINPKMTGDVFECEWSPR